jgi:methylenetetrahydrofolate reductase (NADPH)
MNLSTFYGPNQFGLSFELFPPKTPIGEEALSRHLDELMKFEPSYVTCTYGAGGSTQDKTLRIVADVHQRYDISVATHLTCVGATVDELRSYLQEADKAGVENVVALRGDPPQGDTEFKPVEGGLAHANELVELIHREFPQLGVAVAGYPETHQEAPNAAADLENLCRKVNAGAHVVLTQLFYDNVDYFRFCDDCRAQGITVPIVPGILPVTNLAQIKRISALCGARLPEAFTAELEACQDDAEAQFEVGVRHASRQVQELIDGGAPGIHFYVLNKSQATSRVLREVTR